MLVCSRGSGGSLETRMALLSACWAVGIKAELVPRICPNVSEQYEYANARGIRWLVTIEEGKSNLAKVMAYITIIICMRGQIRSHRHAETPKVMTMS